jgi:regulator of cell morphogenesis and NO signaling
MHDGRQPGPWQANLNQGKEDIMAIDPEQSLAALVTENPSRAPIFERLGLDYCCGGADSLRDAAAKAGLDLGRAVTELEACVEREEPEDWATLSPVELVEHLESTHHVYLREALVRLDALAAKVESVHAENHPELREVRRLVAQVRAELEPHMMKEEQVLFPMVRELAAATELPRFHCGSLRNPIGVMRIEHEQTGGLLAVLRDAADGYRVPSDACASYRALYDGLEGLERDTHLHIHKENNLLFPAVLAEEAALAG